MKGFKFRLKSAIEYSPYNNSFRQLSLDSDLAERFVANLLNNEDMDRSKAGPGLFGMARIADNLNVSLDWLAGRQVKADGSVSYEIDGALLRHIDAVKEQAINGEGPPTPQSLARLHLKSGGRLEGFESVLDYCDLYDYPDGETVKVISLGSKSLASVTMPKDATAEDLERAIMETDGLREKVISDHLLAARMGFLTTREELDRPMPNKPVRVKMDYTMTRMVVDDFQDERYLLCYACLIA